MFHVHLLSVHDILALDPLHKTSFIPEVFRIFSLSSLVKFQNDGTVELAYFYSVCWAFSTLEISVLGNFLKLYIFLFFEKRFYLFIFREMEREREREGEKQQ